MDKEKPRVVIVGDGTEAYLIAKNLADRQNSNLILITKPS